MLKVNDDLKDYLKEAINRGENERYKAYCERFGKDPFSWQWRFKFDNGFGASVIKHEFSYGFEDDLFELAVLRWTGEYHEIAYDTSVTDNVIGFLTNSDVMNYLYQIKNLEGETKNEN
jgi:hypothetical protein